MNCSSIMAWQIINLIFLISSRRLSWGLLRIFYLLTLGGSRSACGPHRVHVHADLMRPKLVLSGLGVPDQSWTEVIMRDQDLFSHAAA